MPYCFTLSFFADKNTTNIYSKRFGSAKKIMEYSLDSGILNR